RCDTRELIVSGKALVRDGMMALLLSAGILFAQPSDPEAVLERAARDFEQGRTADAERGIRAVLEKNPSDLHALLLIAAVLDSRQKYAQGESYYQHAPKMAPASAKLLKNFANHSPAAGTPRLAREYYRKAIAVQPEHANANLQLARMSVEEKH